MERTRRLGPLQVLEMAFVARNEQSLFWAARTAIENSQLDDHQGKILLKWADHEISFTGVRRHEAPPRPRSAERPGNARRSRKQPADDENRQRRPRVRCENPIGPRALAGLPVGSFARKAQL